MSNTLVGAYNCYRNSKDLPDFWLLHPIGRGMGTSFVSAAITNGGMLPGFIFGLGSGAANVFLRPLYRKIDEKTTSPEAKAANYIFSKMMPWIISANIMHQVYKSTGMALFRMQPGPAIATAAIVECFAYVNEDLLEIKKAPPAES